jgi:hypothetical protein
MNNEAVWNRLNEKRPLTMGEWCAIYLSPAPIVKALREFTWRSKITPALRERCIDYALREKDRGGPGTIWRAQKIAEYIAKGERQ